MAVTKNTPVQNPLTGPLAGIGGVGGGGISIKNTNIFADNTARDAYFVSNPSEIASPLVPFISVGAGFQQWSGSAWVTKTAVLQGPQGSPGSNMFVSLTDAASADLPGTNILLAAALATKANASATTAALATKADATATTSALAAKADASALTSGLAAKADSSALTSGLATKADATATTSALATKADASGTTSALAGKQATLISGTNIKTVNSQDITGSGNLIVAGAALTPTTFTPALPLDMESGREMGTHAMSADLTLTVGSSPQVNGSVNFTLNITSGVLNYAAMNLVGPDTPDSPGIYDFVCYQRDLTTKPYLLCQRAVVIILIPAQVSGLAAGTITTTSVQLNWTATPGATGYIVEKSTDGGATFASVATPSSNTSTITGLPSAPGTPLQWRVKATNSAGTGTASTALTATTLIAVPGQVVGLAAGTIGPTSVQLNWTATALAATYLVEKSTDGGTSFSSAATPSTNTATITGLPSAPGTPLKWRVSAVNSSGTGTVSTVLTATTTSSGPAFTFNFNGADGALPSGWVSDGSNPVAIQVNNMMGIPFTAGFYDSVANTSKTDKIIDVAWRKFGKINKTQFLEFFKDAVSGDTMRMSWLQLDGATSTFVVLFEQTISGVTTEIARFGPGGDNVGQFGGSGIYTGIDLVFHIEHIGTSLAVTITDGSTVYGPFMKTVMTASVAGSTYIAFYMYDDFNGDFGTDRREMGIDSISVG